MPKWVDLSKFPPDFQVAYCCLLQADIRRIFGEVRLSVELVPRPCWFSNVRSRVRWSEWERLRKATYAKAGHQCEICGGRGQRHAVECHEIWEYNDKAAIQTLKGLIALCPRCHEVKHIGFAGVRGRSAIAAAHLSQINNWTPPKTAQYLAFTWRIWQIRNLFVWQTNYQWLEQFNIRPKPPKPAQEA